MLVFGERVKKSISEQTKIIPGKIKMPSHEELCYIFNVDNTLTEDKTDNEAWIYLACSYEEIVKRKETRAFIYFIPLFFAEVIALLVLKQPDLGSAIIIGIIALLIFLAVPS